MDSPLFWILVFLFVLLLLGRRIYLGINGWRWQKENPEQAWQNWLNGGH